jgi:oxidase EvaA
MKMPDRDFLKSATCESREQLETNSILEWIHDQSNQVKVEVERVPFNCMEHWSFDPISGSLKHDSGKFFSVEGIRVETNWGSLKTWDQPIINQPEIGYLGFIVKNIEGVLHFLLQAKIEPGNINRVQLSPTIQATRSNYTQIHNGAKPKYLEYFQNVRPENVLLDQLQSEQGARFLMKRNRNIIIATDDQIPCYSNFIWLTLKQIKELMSYDNTINMNTRTVISGICYGASLVENQGLIHDTKISHTTENYRRAFLESVVNPTNSVHSISDIIHFLTDLKSRYDLLIDRIPLGDVEGWQVSDIEISRLDGKYFKVIGVNVSIGNREVASWQQPMIQPSQPGICAFICKKINGTTHLLVQAKLECGNRDVIELAPTVQCLTGDYRHPDSKPVPFLDYVLDAPEGQVVLDALQSEEGGRFYREQNRNLIIIADDSFAEELPETYIWMTLNQLHYFNRFNNYLNIQARSLMAAIPFS